VFDLQKVKYRSSWGNPRTWSQEVPQPDIDLPLYAKSGGKVKISIKAGELVLQSWEAEVTKGLNYPVYHAEISEKSKTDYEKYLNEKRKKEEDEVKLKKAKNDKFYLQQGEYKVLIEKDGKKAEKKLVVE
jgi:hypothetical protein